MGSLEVDSVTEQTNLNAMPHGTEINEKHVGHVKAEEICTNGHGNGHASGIETGTPEVLVTNKQPYTILEEPNRRGRKIRVITIGAGASALNFAHDIDTSPLNIELAIYEKNPEIGGTWYENK